MKFAARQGNLGTDEKQTLDITKELGFDGAELVIINPDEAPLLGSESAREIRAHAADLDVEVATICVGVLNRIGLAAAEDATRATARGIVDRAISAAAEVGAPGLLVPFFGEMRITDQAGSERAITELKSLAPEAEEAGVVLAVECTLNAADTLQIIEGVGSSAVRVYFDMANALYYGYDPVTEVRGLGSAIWQVHVKDATPDNIVPLRQGEVDVPGVIRALREIGYDGYLSFETALVGDKKAALAIDLAYIQGVVAGVG